jgi:hypothetical protein
MAVKYKISTPCVIVVRPFYCKGKITDCHGRSIYEYRGYEHLMEQPDKGRKTVLHVCAHIIEHYKYSTMSHGQNFKKVFGDCIG